MVMYNYKDPLSKAKTLNEALTQQVQIMGEKRWLTYYERDKVKSTLSFSKLLNNANNWGKRLINNGLKKGDRVLLILPTGTAFYESYWGILLAGGVPVPAYPPFRLKQIEGYINNLIKLRTNCGAKLLITDKIIKPLLWQLKEQGRKNLPLSFIIPNEINEESTSLKISVSQEDLGLLQYTSGSTGNQKGVMLTQANLLANIRAIGKTIGLNPKDTAVSWLPLYHDMGLIGLMLGSIYWGIELIALSPLEFLRRPFRWIYAMSHHHATITAAPNFAYNLVARKAKEEELDAADLSSLRIAICGAEPIQPATIKSFVNKFAPCGFKHESFFPAYGLAENTLAVTFSKPGEPPYQECIDMRLLDEERKAVVKKPGEGTRFVVSVGAPIDTVKVRIVDDDGNTASEGILGEVIISGPCVMKGYFNNDVPTARAIKDGWLYTGDVGFKLNGRFFIAGRVKDIIIRAGRNYFAEDIEAAISNLPGIRPGGLCAFSVDNKVKGTEDLVIIAEVRDESYKKDLPDLIIKNVMNACGLSVDKAVMTSPRTLPKTSSGKIQRFKARQMYLDGSLEKKADKKNKIGLFTYLKSWIRDKFTRA